MNIQRVFAVLAAFMIVCSVGLGTEEVHPALLGELLSRIDPAIPDRMHAVIGRWLGDWAWTGAMLPLLRRPAWLPPASLALVATGLAMSVSGRKTPHRSRRRS